MKFIFTYKYTYNPTKWLRSETNCLESYVYMKTISGKKKLLDNIKGRQKSTKTKCMQDKYYTPRH